MSKMDQLMAREMTRKQFLITLGAAIVSLFGFSSIVGMFSQDAPDANNKPVDYGMQNYGP